MSWHRLVDPVFPVVEPFTAAERANAERRLREDLDAIAREDWSPEEARALDEAQRVAAAELDRVKTAESKATTYLATLAALIPLVITIEGSYWERKSGPAPEWLKLAVLAVATVHVAAAGYHAFRALQVSAFQRVTETGLVDAWRSRRPLRRLTRETLAATRASRDAVNAKVTRVKVTQAHLTRAFAAFIALLLLDPAFRAFGGEPQGGGQRPRAAADIPKGRTAGPPGPGRAPSATDAPPPQRLQTPSPPVAGAGRPPTGRAPRAKPAGAG